MAEMAAAAGEKIEVKVYTADAITEWMVRALGPRVSDDVKAQLEDWNKDAWFTGRLPEGVEEWKHKPQLEKPTQKELNRRRKEILQKAKKKKATKKDKMAAEAQRKRDARETQKKELKAKGEWEKYVEDRNQKQRNLRTKKDIKNTLAKKREWQERQKWAEDALWQR